MATLAALINIEHSDGRIIFSITHPVTKEKTVVTNMKQVSAVCDKARLGYDREGLIEVLSQLHYDALDGWQLPSPLKNGDSFIQSLTDQYL